MFIFLSKMKQHFKLSEQSLCYNSYYAQDWLCATDGRVFSDVLWIIDELIWLIDEHQNNSLLMKCSETEIPF